MKEENKVTGEVFSICPSKISETSEHPGLIAKLALLLTPMSARNWIFSGVWQWQYGSYGKLESIYFMLLLNYLIQSKEDLLPSLCCG